MEKERGISPGILKTKCEYIGAELTEPRSGSLFESIKRLVKTTYMKPVLGVHKDRRLMHVYLLLEISIEEGVLNV